LPVLAGGLLSGPARCGFIFGVVAVMLFYDGLTRAAAGPAIIDRHTWSAALFA